MATKNRKTTRSRKKKALGQIKIPRVHSAAKKFGYPAAKVKFNDLSDELKAGFAQFESGGEGSICGVGPSPNPAYWLVCYKDANGICDWRNVPKGAPLEQHE